MRKYWRYLANQFGNTVCATILPQYLQLLTNIQHCVALYYTLINDFSTLISHIRNEYVQHISFGGGITSQTLAASEAKGSSMSS